MKNDPTFKLLAAVIIAGIIMAFANPKSPEPIKLAASAPVSMAGHS